MTRPVRLQRSRRKGVHLESPNGLPNVYVGRGSKWGNPYKASSYKFYSADQNRHAAVRDWLSDLLHFNQILPYTKKDIMAELRGKNLVCWCPLDGYCHADNLLEIANGDE